MGEEALADSGESEVSEMTEIETEDTGIDMESAQDEISEALFGKKEPEEQEEVIEDSIEETEEEPVEEVNEEPEAPAKTAPQSWKKEMAEKFNGLDPEVQDYIHQREEQMKEGLEKDRGDANLGRVMRDTMAPFSQLLQQQGINEADAVKNFMTMHYKMSTSDPDTKRGLLMNIAKAYGIQPPQKDADGNPVKVDPVVQNLQNELQGVKQQLNQSSQRALQEAREKVQADVAAFANDEANPYFNEVSNEMVAFINEGMELKEAYEKAVWANPVTRQKEIERIQAEKDAEAQKLRKQEVEKAKKLKSTNVKGRNTTKTPTGPTGTMEDTMRETLREIKNRT